MHNKALGEAFAGVQKAGPLVGLQRGSAPSRKHFFVFGELKMHNFRPFFSLNSLKIHHKLPRKNGQALPCVRKFCTW